VFQNDPTGTTGGIVAVPVNVSQLQGTPLTLNGGGGSNTLQGADVANVWQLLGSNSGTLDGLLHFNAMANLAGGSGADTFRIGTGGVSGSIDGGGDSILIGGTTAYDQNLTALQAIMAEFARTDRNFHQRVNDIMTGTGLNGPYVLNTDPTLGPVTVFDDGAADTLTGGGGLDWFFVHKRQDLIVNKKPGDKINYL
jgi:hypothetical protein